MVTKRFLVLDSFEQEMRQETAYSYELYCRLHLHTECTGPTAEDISFYILY